MTYISRENIIQKYPLTQASIRASLLVLMQHSICKTSLKPFRGGTAWFYEYEAQRAVYLLRYPKFIEFTRKQYDTTASCVVEVLCLAGRLRTTQLVLQAASIAPSSVPYTSREAVMQAFLNILQGGLVEIVQELQQEADGTDDDDQEWDPDQDGERKLKRRKKVKMDSNALKTETQEDAGVYKVWKSNAQYKALIPLDAVWRVNVNFFHEWLRANTLGKLVAERYTHKIQSCGIMVSAALRHRSALRHGVSSDNDETKGQIITFQPENIVRYLPKPVVHNLEKKPGGLHATIARSLTELSHFDNPSAIRRVRDDSFEVDIRSLCSYLHDRIAHKVVSDRHGETAGRVISILGSLGWLESDKIAEHAMVPIQDTRELLHELYRSRYVDLFTVSTARMPSSANSTFLWSSDRERRIKVVTSHVALALWNIRLRRQHEEDVGREWIERAQKAGDTDENENRNDRLNYERFWGSLERLDNAALQLDETLMILRDYSY